MTWSKLRLIRKLRPGLIQKCSDSFSFLKPHRHRHKAPTVRLLEPQDLDLYEVL